MNLQETYDDAMFDFGRGDYSLAAEKLRTLLAEDPTHFEAQLALGMTFYRLGDYTTALAEGHKAERMRPKDPLVHTNLSLFYMKAGDKATAEHHGLQARIAGWREDPEAKKVVGGDPELQLAKPKAPTLPRPERFPDMPWKKKPKLGSGPP